MTFNSIPSLVDICATSIVYKIWTHQNIYENWNERNQHKLLRNKVTTDVKRLPLPGLIKSFLLQLVKPTGYHLCAFLRGWFHYVKTSEAWLKTGMLSDCLTLYAVGIINRHKTTEKLIRSKPLDNKIAFQLACLNCLEVDILRLWPLVSQHFRSMIALESEMSEEFWESSDRETRYIQYAIEVLRWVSYCSSKENEVDLNAMPVIDEVAPSFTSNCLCHGQVSFIPGGSSSGTSFFKYIEKGCTSFAEEHVVLSDCVPWEMNLICSFYHFSNLNSERKTQLFNEIPISILFYFLRWPLSSLFLENLELMSDLLVRFNKMDLLFIKILEIVHCRKYPEHHRRNVVSYMLGAQNVYSNDHLERIWTAVWDLCSAEMKSRIVTSLAFTENRKTFLRKASSKMKYNVSNLTNDLQKLFQSNGDAFLLFLSERNLTDALEKVVSKYMPEKKIEFSFAAIKIS